MIQYSVQIRNAKANVNQAEIGPADLELRSGPPARSCASPAAGELIVQGELPEVWMLPARNGIAKKSGEWKFYALKDGTIGHYRIYDKNGKCHEQGTYGVDGDMIGLETVRKGQPVVVVSFTKIAGNE